MADVYVNALTTISTEPATTDSIVVVNRNTNEGQIIDYELLADKILDKLTSKTYSGLDTTSKILVGAINEVRTTGKRLLPVTVIPENSNLDSLTTPGEYYCGSNASAATIVNSPTSNAFRLTVETSLAGTTYLRQTLHGYVDNIEYTRYSTNSGSTWSAWAKPDDAVVFQLGNAKSTSFTMRNNVAVIIVKRDNNYQMLYLDYWSAGASTVVTNGNTLLTVTKSANSFNVTITNNYSTQTCGIIINPTSETTINVNT